MMFMKMWLQTAMCPCPTVIAIEVNLLMARLARTGQMGVTTRYPLQTMAFRPPWSCSFGKFPHLPKLYKSYIEFV